MPELLLEVGCEELPASAFPACLQGLADQVQSRLAEAGLEPAEIRTACTPRRLIVSALGIPSRQADRVDRRRGPRAESAYDAEGRPTRALEGFCRGQGVAVESVQIEGGYVIAEVAVPGRAAAEVCAEILPEAIRLTPFAKQMRWGGRSERYARPIRWIVAVMDGGLVAMDWAGVASGMETRGPRGTEPFAVRTWDELIAGLRERGIEPDPAERERLIREGARQAGEGRAEIVEALVAENVHLTESPRAHRGSFDPGFLRLPEPVLVTAMAKHEKFFPMRGEDGRIMAGFVSIRNGGEEGRVRRGNEWVLNNRFNDAAFFFDEDSRRTLESFREDLEGMQYHQGLGSVLQKSDRMERIARAAAAQAGLDPELAGRAGRLAKADLSTGLVDELSSLQGRIGAEYALRDGHPEAAAQAIGAHYSIEACSALEGEARRAAFLLLMADLADKLAGYLGLGLAPKGSADPFALRQAATQLIAAGWARPWPHIELEEVFAESWAAYAGQGIALDPERGREGAEALLRARYEQLIDAAHDAKRSVLEISGLAELGRPSQIRRRALTAALVRTEADFVRTLRRPVSIVASAEEKGWRPDDSGHPESALALRLAEAGRAAAAALASDPPPSPEEARAALAGLAEPIHGFFEGTLVMAEDPAERSRNLNLLAEIRASILSLFDPRLLVLEGEEKA